MDKSDTLSVPASNNAPEEEQRTLAEEPRPEKVEPVDIEKGKKHEAGASWKAKEVHEIPHKYVSLHIAQPLFAKPMSRFSNMKLVFPGYVLTLAPHVVLLADTFSPDSC